MQNNRQLFDRAVVGTKRKMRFIASLLAVVLLTLALLTTISSSILEAANGATLYYIQSDDDPRNATTQYYLNTIHIASDGTATFGTPKLINGIVRDDNGSLSYILSMTQLANGSLLGTVGHNGWARIFTISAADIAGGGDVTATMGGAIDTTIEGAFTGCDGAIYLGDSGDDATTPGGSIIRLDPATLNNSKLGFTKVVETTTTDIDGLGPGIVDNKIVDSPGYALDSGKLLTWNFNSGAVTPIGSPGVNYELHALGGEHFDDGQARLFGLQAHPFKKMTIELREINLNGQSSTLVQKGPDVYATGLTGPLDCTETSIPSPPKPDEAAAAYWCAINSPVTDTPQSKSGVTTVEFIMDGSYSMIDKNNNITTSEGTFTRLDTARSALKQVIGNIDPNTNVALRVFGETGKCESELTIPRSSFNKNIFAETIDKISPTILQDDRDPSGKTYLPASYIAGSLREAVDDLKDVSGQKLLVLLTDGAENCDSEGDAAVKQAIDQLKAAGIDVRLNIVGFAIEDDALKQKFREWAEALDGSYFDATDAASLNKAIKNALEVPSDYRLVYSLAIPVDSDFNDDAVPYDVDNSASVASYDRVAYCMQLDDQWVWVSMDDFTDGHIEQTGVPVASVNPDGIQQKVTNMDVASNVSEVVTGNGIATGNIEFWSNCYGPQPTLGLSQADDSYDFDDTKDETRPSCYGSMQVHNYGAQQTVFAFNAWDEASGQNNEVGIGNAPTDNPDWTFARNANDYTERRLSVFVRETEADVDTDGDGLLDRWETEGLTYTANGVTEFVDLPAMGANPRRKDIFVEIDYMVANDHTHKPNPKAIAMIVEAFKNAPVTNEDGSTGIQLHVDYGPDAPLTYAPVSGGSVPTWGALSRGNPVEHSAYLGQLAADGNYSWEAFYKIKKQHFSPGRAAVFHYNLWIHEMVRELNGSSGMGHLPGSDFIVSLGRWTNQVGTPYEQAGTFMHELGHNLGLRHGGTDDINFKPNYLSVMSYAWQTKGLIRNSTQELFDYSRFALPDLDEKALDETVTVFGPTAANGNYGTLWYCNQGEKFTQNVREWIDWNCNNVQDSQVVSADITNDKALDVLRSRNDWDNIVYAAGSIGVDGAGYTPPLTTEVTEITKEEADQIPALYPEVIPPKTEVIETYELQHILKGHKDGVWQVAWSPDGRQLVTASDDHTVKIWDVASLTVMTTLEGHTDWAYSAVWSPDGTQVASASEDKTVRIWNVGTGQQIRLLKEHGAPVRSVAWSPDGTMLASGSEDQTVKVWNTTDWTLRDSRVVSAAVYSVAWSPDSAQLAFGKENKGDGEVGIWDLSNGLVDSLHFGDSGIRYESADSASVIVRSVAWSDNGARLAAGDTAGDVLIWDMLAFKSQFGKERISGPQALHVLKDQPIEEAWAHEGEVRSVAWSPDGSRLATSSTDKTIRIWDTVSGKLVATLKGANDYVDSVDWSPDGAQLASSEGAYTDEMVRIWGRSVEVEVLEEKAPEEEEKESASVSPSEPERNQPDPGLCSEGLSYLREQLPLIEDPSAWQNEYAAIEENLLVGCQGLDEAFSERSDPDFEESLQEFFGEWPIGSLTGGLARLNELVGANCPGGGEFDCEAVGQAYEEYLTHAIEIMDSLR